MIKYKVDKKVPMPLFRTIAKYSRYPYAEMEIGDSFYVPENDVASKNSLKTTSYAACKKNQGKLFRVADDKDGYRVFRVK